MLKMSRQVDVKALISHIVRGDGSDRCRICMGDTTDGQVHLEDTVLMDGDKPVTLAELLEAVTGVEVDADSILPSGLCRACSDDVIAAMNLRNLCAQSWHHWNDATAFLSQVYKPTEDDRAYFVLYRDEKAIITDQVDRVPNVKEALNRLNLKYKKKPQKMNKPKPKPNHNLACSCQTCGKQFSAPEYLNLHLKGSLQRACVQCGSVLPKQNIAKHYKEEHDTYVVECEVCHEVFDDDDSMIEHWAQNHTSPHTCSVCRISYNNPRALRAHLYAHTLFHCKSCKLEFDNVKCYKYHQKKCKIVEETAFNKFTCDDCGVEYDLKPSLRIHIIQKHLNVLPYVCQVCGKRTSTLAHLKSHEQVHETQRKVYQCYCGAKMRTELGYQLHQRIHTGERPYECKFCGDRFLSSSRRLDHIKRRHKGAKIMPHACKECAAKFVRPCELKKHYLSVHYTVVNVKPAKREIDPITGRFRRTFRKVKAD